MNEKYDLAMYLVNLHTLMDAQRANGQTPSATLGAEYNRGWAQLKEMIRETRRSEQERPGGSKG